MAKFFILPIGFLIFTSLLFGGFFAMSASAAELEGPKESCEIDPSRIPLDKFTITTFNGTNDIIVTNKLRKGIISEKGNIGDGTEATPKYKSKEWAIICLVDTIGTITGWIFFALMSVSVLFVVAAAFVWITAGAKPENQKKAGQMILAALIGIAIAMLARIIPGVVTGILA